MTKRDAQRLAKKIAKDAPGCTVTGMRVWTSERRPGHYSYEVEVVDTRTGYPFVVTSSEDWVERLSRTIP